MLAIRVLFNPLSFVVLIFFAHSPTSYANETEASKYYEQGVQYYEKQEYDNARTAFEQAVKLSPSKSEYHHMLGKSYGRIAQQSNWIRAMYLARKTLDEFRRAAELDDQNEQVINDLIQYYLQAPPFLGGSKKKAKALQEKLKKLQENDENRS